MADPVPNQPAQPTAPVNPQPAPTPAAGQPIVTQAAGGSSKNMIWIIVAAFIVVAILVGVGIFMYMQVKQENPAFQQVSESTQQSVDTISNDLSSVKVDEPDFSGVDQDLKSL